MAAAVILGTASCSHEPDTLEPEHGLQGTVLARHESVSDGQPVALGPYSAQGDLNVQAACLGGGKIDVKVYADRFTPSMFTNRHAGAIAYLTKDSDGALGTLFGSKNEQGSQHCIVVSFIGDVTKHRVTVSGAAGPEPISPLATPAPAATPHRFPCPTGS
ncbi:hypothetical protein [Catellatospora citrea]|uniref:hypothetical protein n=1 Tax=Catellatospora citrea TaxID=53366 RepID=UPI0011C36B65|nr:hypothetical protein [Catellatospora citrea]